MDLAEMFTQTKLIFQCLLNTYHKCIFNRLHDLAMHILPSTEVTNASNIVKSEATRINKPIPIEKNKMAVHVLSHNLAGIPHLEAISELINRPIEIYDENERLKVRVGNNTYDVVPVKVQYHKDVQHYTLLGAREPYASAQNGMCLYNCISDHTRTEPTVLKAFTLERLGRFITLDAYDGVDLLWGGAAYTGNGPQDAGMYLDNCQGKQGHRFPARAHPRGHASNPMGVGIEAYSNEGWKTGFESYGDQNFVAHFALNNAKTINSMDSLNRGNLREVVHLTRYDLGLPRPVPAGTWVSGSRTESFDVGTVTLVIQHYQGEYSNPDAPVFIQTMFPRHPNR